MGHAGRDKRDEEGRRGMKREVLEGRSIKRNMLEEVRAMKKEAN